jgi:hypothetical protein
VCSTRRTDIFYDHRVPSRGHKTNEIVYLQTRIVKGGDGAYTKAEESVAVEEKVILHHRVIDSETTTCTTKRRARRLEAS